MPFSASNDDDDVIVDVDDDNNDRSRCLLLSAILCFTSFTLGLGSWEFVLPQFPPMYIDTAPITADNEHSRQSILQEELPPPRSKHEPNVFTASAPNVLDILNNAIPFAILRG
jgi:hypothetical protein